MTSVDINNKSSGSKIIPIGLGILFVLVAIGSYLLGTGNNQTVVSNQQNSAVPTTIPTPVDETADWKIYKNTTYGFEIMYPQDFAVINDTLPKTFTGTLKRENLEISNDVMPENPKLTIWVNLLGVGGEPRDIDYDLAPTENKGLRIDLRTEIPESQEWIDNHTIDNQIVISGKTVKLGTNTYTFKFTFQEGGKDYEPIFNKILSTFKFTDPAKTDETANWQTYTDTKLKFSIKYPSDIAISRTLPEGGVEFSLASELEKDFRERSIRLNIYYRGDKNITPKEAQESECPKPCTDVAEKTTINNASGVKVVSTNSELYYLASTNSNVVGIFLVFLDTTSKSFQTDLEKFRQILSTFQFTN